MSDAENIVHEMLDGQEPEEPIDPKAELLRSQADQQALEASLPTRGPVNASTVKAYGTIYHRKEKKADGSPVSVKVTSVKTWKTRPDEFEIGWKYGMRQYGKINPHNAADWTTIEPPPGPKPTRRR